MYICDIKINKKKMKKGTKVRLTKEAKNDTYFDMDWKDDYSAYC